MFDSYLILLSSTDNSGRRCYQVLHNRRYVVTMCDEYSMLVVMLTDMSLRTVQLLCSYIIKGVGMRGSVLKRQNSYELIIHNLKKIVALCKSVLVMVVSQSTRALTGWGTKNCTQFV